VPESRFGEIFETAEDCITAAFKEGLDRLSQAVLQAARGDELWLERIRAGVLALLVFLDENPDWAHLLILERPFEGAMVAECTQRVLHALPEVLQEARPELVVGPQLEPPAELIAELIATAVLSVIRARMLKGQSAPLAELAPSLMRQIIEPYLGRGAAKADRPHVEPEMAQTPVRPEVLPMRPHPRPVLALQMIASTPHLSNQQVGVAIGIDNDGGGQISQLLRLLQRRGLIENTSPNRRRAEPNAWLLTPYGHRALELLTGKTAPTSVREHAATLPARAFGRPVPRSSSRPARAARRAA